MVASLDIENAMTMSRAAPVRPPHAGSTPDATRKAAREFESVFITQFLGSMFEGLKSDGMFGGGQGEQMFRSMMLDQYGKTIADQGGFGLADSITRSLTIHQEAKQRALAEAKADNGAKREAPPIPVQRPQLVLAAHPETAFATSLAAIQDKQP